MTTTAKTQYRYATRLYIMQSIARMMAELNTKGYGVTMFSSKLPEFKTTYMSVMVNDGNRVLVYDHFDMPVTKQRVTEFISNINKIIEDYESK